jgi:NAD(P)-dependent dehydrogenase (short-subunit alcohol dehydrogenase family)
MDLQLANKKVLITASTGGIGKQIAKQFADEGATVIINGRSKETAEQTLSELKEKNKNVFSAVGNVATEEGIKNIINEIFDLGGIDILVNNAGLYINHDWFNSTADDWMQLYSVNVVSSVNLIQAFVPHMKENKWGRIIQISSGEATQPFAFMPDYAATKAALNNLTVSLSKALSKTGITVNTVSPGIIATDTLKEFYTDFGKKNNWGNDWQEIERKILETVLNNNIGRLGTPEDVANLVCFIASPLADNINGANLRTDGGSTISIN